MNSTPNSEFCKQSKKNKNFWKMEPQNFFLINYPYEYFENGEIKKIHIFLLFLKT